MSNLSQVERIIELLKSKPNEKLNASALASLLVEHYPEDYEEKRRNPRFKKEEDLLSQIRAEIGAHKNNILTKSKNVFWQDKPRPRVFWFDTSNLNDTQYVLDDEKEADKDYEIITIPSAKTAFTEHDLYPILIEYLKSEFKLFCLRIDEKKSKNSRGDGGNIWLHPDIVAMQAIDMEWDPLVKDCVKHGSGKNVRLLSFEVKIELNNSNVRKNFFQAVSNSSWANEGYLVTTSIANSCDEELKMLSALHGIGVIILKPENPSESEVFLPAKTNLEVDWASVNRIVLENSDFKKFIDFVSDYYQRRCLRNEWNKI